MKMCCPLVTIPGKVTNEDFSPLVPFFKKDTNERCRLSTVFSKKVPNDIGENSDVLAQGTKTKKVPYTICD
ncbi:TPA: hypothetical protein OTQ43_000635 [Klebsiella pneumoniae]|nr:hypothetical protein [Klebsiella pneumoniae]HBR9376570.1 hypothetical protein [Klebsiella pneumoniae]HCT2045970.1 hypothetical protein [Klebsiella pneumoniae]